MLIKLVLLVCQTIFGSVSVSGNASLGAAPSAVLPLDLSITFTGAWSTHPLSAAATNLFLLRRVSDSTTMMAVASAGNVPNYATINTFLTSTTGRIVTLYDQTGNGGDATQGTAAQQPGYTLHLGRATADATVDSGNAYYTLAAGPGMTGRNFSVYAVYDADERTFSGATLIYPSIPYWGPASAGAYSANITRAAAELLHLAWGTFPNTTISPSSGNGNINIAVWRSTGSATHFRVNSVTQDSATLTDTTTKTLTQLLRCPAVSSTSPSSRLLAFLVGPAHTDLQETAVVAALQSLFGTAAKTTQVLVDGDSQTAGQQLATSFDERDMAWPYLVASGVNNPAVFLSNRAISSSQLVDGTGNAEKDLTLWAPNKIDAAFNSAYSKHILIVMAGRNDVSVASAAAAYTSGTTYAAQAWVTYSGTYYRSLSAGNVGNQPDISPTFWDSTAVGSVAYARLLAYCAARKAATSGLKVIVLTGMLDKPLATSGFNAQMVLYQGLINGDANTHWDATVDTYALNWQPGGSSDWTTNYQGDNLHPNGAGRAMIANAVQPILAGML